MPNEDDAMFTKKHLGPMACASCEKNLINLIGQPVDYHVWKRMPNRDPSERIARYGPGFSKILSHIKVDNAQPNIQTHHMHHYSVDDSSVVHAAFNNESPRVDPNFQTIGSKTQANGFNFNEKKRGAMGSKHNELM